MKKLIRRIIILGLVIGLLGSIAIAHIKVLPHKVDIFYQESNLPERDIAVVFGGGMREDGTQTTFQSDRVLTAIDLYQQGKIKKIVVSGDDGTNRSNEVDAMKQMLLDADIPEEVIVQDRKSFRTYESCYRMREIFGLSKIIAISQEFHLPRIIYLCESVGIDTIGFAADRHDYREDLKKAQIREVFAKVKAWVQAEITKPEPSVLGVQMLIR